MGQAASGEGLDLDMQVDMTSNQPATTEGGTSASSSESSHPSPPRKYQPTPTPAGTTNLDPPGRSVAPPTPAVLRPHPSLPTNASAVNSTIAYLQAMIAKTEESAKVASAHDRDIAMLHAQLVSTTEAARREQAEQQAAMQLQLQQQYESLAKFLHEQHRSVHAAQMQSFKRAKLESTDTCVPPAEEPAVVVEDAPLLTPLGPDGADDLFAHFPWTPVDVAWQPPDAPMHHPSDVVDASVAASPVMSSTPAIDHSSESGTSLMHLRMFQEVCVLELLEQQHARGHLCSAAVRQQLMWILGSLEPTEQSELLEQFQVVPLPGLIRALYSCRHYDTHLVPGVPCCPLRASPEWGGRMVADARRACELDPHACCTLHPESRQALNEAMAAGLIPRDHAMAMAMIPSGSGVDQSPLEPAEDDIDGVARMRFTVLFRPSALDGPTAGSKRKLSASREEAASARSPSEKLSAEIDATVDKLAHMAMEPSEHMDRAMQINKAAERLTGYTQAELRLLVLDCSPSNPWQQIRPDHARAAARIGMRWRLNNISEGHMFHVRLARDGAETYCLIHVKFHLVQGLLIGCEQSILPLPDDPERPPPPFVEGVDLDEDCLLYGYKPPPTR